MSEDRRKAPYERRNFRPEAERLALERADANASTVPAEKLLHELQIHQIELEMQNDELRRAHIALEELSDRYFDWVLGS